ncbi:hypothetical protein ECC02_010906 [Trypanosoma cruzi]|uniref:Uncharacterized protein n=1 Tax=Trypanosoma cruzi TaxID=5693 RepID=A0A7J6XQ66_TRYCR|nr:hypothetical protein ECC02_010906 [Trypanosoma cruzi]
MSFNRLTLHVSAHRLYFMGSSACCCSPQPSHRHVSAARRAQSLVCVWGLREARRHDGSRVTPSGSERRKEKKSSEGREMLTRPTPKGAPAQKKKRTQRKIPKKRQGVAVCVWRCGCLPALAAIKQNKRERNVCSASQALVARPHVTAPSARRSSRPLLMRAAGEAHRAVVISVSVGVRVEQLGGKHTALLTGRVQKKQLKREE